MRCWRGCCKFIPGSWTLWQTLLTESKVYVLLCKYRWSAERQYNCTQWLGKIQQLPSPPTLKNLPGHPPLPPTITFTFQRSLKRKISKWKKYHPYGTPQTIGVYRYYSKKGTGYKEFSTIKLKPPFKESLNKSIPEEIVRNNNILAVTWAGSQSRTVKLQNSIKMIDLFPIQKTTQSQYLQYTSYTMHSNVSKSPYCDKFKI